MFVGLEDVDLLEEEGGDTKDEEEEGLPNTLILLG